MACNVILALLLSLAAIGYGLAQTACNPRDFGHGSNVCVCNAESCDSVSPVEPVGENQAVIYTSDKSGRRLERTVVQLTTNSKPNVVVDPSQKLQAIEGFGGAFTDASGINIYSLPKAAQDLLLRSYFGQDGIEYNVGRVVISSSDFSARKYSYDDVKDDFTLENFALTEEDLQYKIPFIKSALELSNKSLKLFASSWSAPAWMKESGRMESNGSLLGDPIPGDRYYTAWANYYVKFLQEYEKNGLKFFALTAQNEPTTGFLYEYLWQTQAFTAEMQRDFIKNNLGPALRQNGFNDIGIMILDDQRFLLPSWARTVLADKEARKYVSHIAVHWYWDRFTPTKTLDLTHDQFPNVPLLATEACVGTIGSPDAFKAHVILGSWERAESYAHSIIEDLNHWFVGWIDWNIVLDLQGGPNWAKNNVDSPIIVNATSGEFYKQPMFYILGHFSKFLPRNSYRIGMKSTLQSAKVELTSFLNANGYKTVIAMNKEEKAVNLSLSEAKKNQVVEVTLPPRSVVTVLWK